jgi:hypothetical protein
MNNMTSDLYVQVETLQNLLVSKATGGTKEKNEEYLSLRSVVFSSFGDSSLVPKFLSTCRNLDQFWQFIKRDRESYQERREYLWNSFRPLLDFLERGDGGASGVPSDLSVTARLQKFDAAYVKDSWSKALSRREADPEGAITSARTLVESVCKHILDESKVSYDDTADLPKLYRQTAEVLNLAPSQHTEQVFKQILGGCASVVEGLGALRNKLSDAHGKGRAGVKPASRHAELAVNLSGALANYLLATWEARNEG